MAASFRPQKVRDPELGLKAQWQRQFSHNYADIGSVGLWGQVPVLWDIAGWSCALLI